MKSRQAAVETVLALMRASAGGRPARLPTDPPWEEAVAVASSGLVLPALAAGARALPGGLEQLGEAGSFLRTLEEANAARNKRLMERLREAAAALDAAGIPAVALKGSVFALEDAGCSPWRFFGDLDMLVPADRIADAVQALAPLSYSAQGLPDLGAELHHHPPLLHADGVTFIELHTRLFPDVGIALLPPERLLVVSRPPKAAPELLVPPAVERMVHLIAHSQLANGRFRRRTLSLRDALDFAVLSRGGELDLNQVREQFEAHGHGPAAAGFIAAMGRLQGEGFPVPGWAASGEDWAEAAVRSLSSPGRVRRRIAWDMLVDHARRLLGGEGRRRAWAALRDPTRRRGLVRRKLFGWRNIR